VAHCGTDIEGAYLYTLTLTVVATGWTKCLPLLYRSQETVLAAIQRGRMLFPYPILGIDTDNGEEFINEVLIACWGASLSAVDRTLPSDAPLFQLLHDGQKVRCVYDGAKTPLQRLLLSGIITIPVEQF
jgi:hypothetical protein